MRRRKTLIAATSAAVAATAIVLAVTTTHHASGATANASSTSASPSASVVVSSTSATAGASSTHGSGVSVPSSPSSSPTSASSTAAPAVTSAAPAPAPACTPETVTVKSAAYGDGTLNAKGSACLVSGRYLWALAPAVSNPSTYRYKASDPITTGIGAAKAWTASVPWFGNASKAVFIAGDGQCYLELRNGPRDGDTHVIQHLDTNHCTVLRTVAVT